MCISAASGQANRHQTRPEKCQYSPTSSTLSPRRSERPPCRTEMPTLPCIGIARTAGLKLMEIKRLRQKGHKITLLNETQFWRLAGEVRHRASDGFHATAPHRWLKFQVGVSEHPIGRAEYG